MVANVAFLNRGQFIVWVVFENSRWSLRVSKNRVVNHRHILLCIGRYQKTTNRKYRENESEPVPQE